MTREELKSIIISPMSPLSEKEAELAVDMILEHSKAVFTASGIEKPDKRLEASLQFQMACVFQYGYNFKNGEDDLDYSSLEIEGQEFNLFDI